MFMKSKKLFDLFFEKKLVFLPAPFL